ncbi:hypothetical protein [Actinoplanes sp. NPDC020271]|uniref:hypothetical protein n=1 Tax=Actinoplanes sp. NPDC020271 TaxID=3363896 RepID=UPI0037B480FB
MRVISRRTDAGIEVFSEDLESSRVFPVPPGFWGWSAPSTRDALVYATGDSAVIRIDPDGREQWRLDLGTEASNGQAAMIAVQFSADDAKVWVYAPDGMPGHDAWIVLDATTGEVESRRSLAAAGQGAEHFPLRDGRMLLDVGEGQDGSLIFLAGPEGEPHDYGWSDRVLIDVSPDERQFMTIDHDGQADVALHAFPGGEVLTRLTVADFGEDPEVGVIEWTGGYLDAETAIVVVYGEDEESDGPWWRHYRVGTRTGEVLGDLGIVTIDENDLQPLGDGTFVVTDTDGTLRRM